MRLSLERRHLQPADGRVIPGVARLARAQWEWPPVHGSSAGKSRAADRRPTV